MLVLGKHGEILHGSRAKYKKESVSNSNLRNLNVKGSSLRKYLNLHRYESVIYVPLSPGMMGQVKCV